MDRVRLFRTLYYLYAENNILLLAQDAHVIIKLCRGQLSELAATIVDMTHKANGDEALATSYKKCIADLEAIQPQAPHIIDGLSHLQDLSKEFWMCAPLDHSKRTDSIATRRWGQFVSEGQPLDEELRALIETFRTLLEAFVAGHFPDLLSQLKEEEEFENKQLAGLSETVYDLLNCIPIGWAARFRATTISFIVLARFPLTHFNYVDPAFAKLLGFSTSRLLACPLALIILDNTYLTELVDEINGGRNAPTPTMILSYRTNRRGVRTVQWEMCSEEVNGCYGSVGVDITGELDAFKESSAANTQKMLRQWLHSIRNASFEQQAAVLLDELEELKLSMGRNRDLEPRFENLTAGLTMLMKTAKRSVGLIDHALDTKGFIQLMSVHDFIENLSAFPSVAAEMADELPAGIEHIGINVTCILNDTLVSPADVSGLFVKCDILNIQAFVNRLIISSASCTDPSKGIHIYLSMLSVGSSNLKFRLFVADFCPGGMADSLFDKWRDSIGPLKCNDYRGRCGDYNRVPEKFRRVVNTAPAPEASPGAPVTTLSADQSVSSAALPHLLELRNRLVHSNGDTDVSFETFDTGTTFKLKFDGGINTPSSQLESTPQHDDDLARLQGCVLVVDDSAVIRKIICRFLESLHVTHHACRDGLEASEWFKANSKICCGIITDLEMPNLGGDALIAMATSISPDLPCYVVSGNDIAPVNLPQGARRAIKKPVVTQDVYFLLREIVSLQIGKDMADKYEQFDSSVPA